MSALGPKDLVAALAPTLGVKVGGMFAALTLADWKDIASIAGGVLGTAYLLWKWRKEARTKGP